MNKKLILFNYSLLGAILFAVLFQSAHSFEHLVKQLTTEHCHHKYNKNRTEFSHAHNNFDNCFVCEYSFSNFIPIDFYSFELKILRYNTISLFGYKENLVFFSGSTTKSRGPPFLKYL